MKSGSRLLLGLLMALILGGLAWVGWWALGSRPARSGSNAVELEPLSSPVLAQDPAPTPRVELQNEEPLPSQTSTTVVWPLELELELVEARDRLQAEGMPAQGSSATARIKGSVLFTIDRPVAARIRFEKGPNEGRVLTCDASGRFGATDLYPGLALVRVEGPGIPGALRQVRLRQNNEEQLHISYARLTPVEGRVVTREDLPIAGAEVSFDGQATQTDENGWFRYEGIAPGKALLIIKKPGFASVLEEFSVPAMGKLDPARLKFALDKGARLTIELPDRVRTDLKAQIVIVPGSATAASGARSRGYPWFLVNPIECYPGGTVSVEDLPPGDLALRCFHVGARAKPTQRAVRLDPGGEHTASFTLEPAPVIQGTVTLGGQPVQNAQVTIEAADRLAASLAALGEPMNLLYLESDIFPALAPALQTIYTDAQGRFELTNWESAIKERYLIARYDSGRKLAFRALRGGETKVDLALEASGGGQGALRLRLPERTQGLPWRVTVSGEPRGLSQLAPGRDLVIGNLAEGTWKLSARWNGEVLANGEMIEVRGESERPLHLPTGAIEGQDEDTRRRAGPQR